MIKGIEISQWPSNIYSYRNSNFRYIFHFDWVNPGRMCVKDGTYNILFTKASKLCQFLGHEEFGFANSCQEFFMDLIREINGFITKVFFEITDLLFNMEDFIL